MFAKNICDRKVLYDIALNAKRNIIGSLPLSRKAGILSCRNFPKYWDTFTGYKYS